MMGEKGAEASGHREVGSAFTSGLTSHPSVRVSLDPGERRGTEVNVERR